MEPAFFYGAMSPYSWFAAERIGALIPGATWRPVFAGGLFEASERSSWGLDERRPAGLAACEARAAAHGLGPIRWPEAWPTLDVVVARAMLHAEREDRLQPFSLAAMRLAFREAGDLGELAIVLEAGRRAGLEPGALERATQDPGLKDELRRRNDEARGLGVFGVPTVVVDGELFWGDDRLGEAAAAAVSRSDG